MIRVCLCVKPTRVDLHVFLRSLQAFSRPGFCMQNKSEFPWLIYVSCSKDLLVGLDQILANS